MKEISKACNLSPTQLHNQIKREAAFLARRIAADELAREEAKKN
jgi:hypothetical protein